MKKLSSDLEKRIRRHVIRKLKRRGARGGNTYIPIQYLKGGMDKRYWGYLKLVLDKMQKNKEITLMKRGDTISLLLSNAEIAQILNEE